MVKTTINNATETQNAVQGVTFTEVTVKYDGAPHQISITALPEPIQVSSGNNVGC